MPPGVPPVRVMASASDRSQPGFDIITKSIKATKQRELLAAASGYPNPWTLCKRRLEWKGGRKQIGSKGDLLELLDAKAIFEVRQFENLLLRDSEETELVFK